MKAYNRVMAGSRSVHAAQCFNEGFIGVDYQIPVDLNGRLPENWRDFNREGIDFYRYRVNFTLIPTTTGT